MNDPLEIFKETDSAFFNALGNDRALAFTEGAMSKKEKLIIGMTLDATKGAVLGTRSLAMQALEAGATKEELVEALRIAYFIYGIVSTYTAAEALKDLF